MLIPIAGHTPQVAPGAWVAPTATLIGDVVVEDGASIWYGVVVRGDTARIRIGARSNVQDNSTLHADPEAPLDLGTDVTVGHAAVVHGCTVEDGCLIGIGARVLNHAVVGRGSLVAAGAVVREREQIPPGSMVAGVPARVLGPLPEVAAERLPRGVAAYTRLAALHREATAGLVPDAIAAAAAGRPPAPSDG